MLKLKLRYLFFKKIKIRGRKRFTKIFFLILSLYNSIHNYISLMMISDRNINLFVKNNYNLKVLKFLKFFCFTNCMQLLDFIVVDRLEIMKLSNYRFECIYVLNSIIYNIRVFIKSFILQFSYILSAINLFKSINWLEREAWDMFGIIFLGHNDLRRILTDYGFIGHPFKKDFPLTGYTELRYDDIIKVIVNEPLELSQEFRYFRLENVWKKW